MKRLASSPLAVVRAKTHVVVRLGACLVIQSMKDCLCMRCALPYAVKSSDAHYSAKGMHCRPLQRLQVLHQRSVR